MQYVKVTEYQKRGLVHFHLLIRLDAARPPSVERLGVPWRLPHRIAPPPAGYTVEPLDERDRDGGYWWELSMRQVEVFRTLVFDAPRRARAFFEALVRDNLGIGA